MNRERNFTPLSEINRQGMVEIPIWKNSKRKTEILFNMDLPEYIDQDVIGVQLPRLSRSCRLGGIRQLHVRSQAGEVTSYVPDAVGMGPDGVVFAGASGTAKKVKRSSSQGKESTFPLNCAVWKNIQVTMNTSEMIDRIQQRKQKLRSQDAWSAEINSALQRELFKAGSRNLIGVDNKVGMITGLAEQGIFGAAMSTAQSLLQWCIETQVLVHMFEQVNGKSFGLDTRFSFIPSFQLDRAVVLAGVTAKDWLLGTQSLVKPLSEGKK